MQMTLSIRKSLVGLLVASAAACTGTVGSQTGPGGKTGGLGGNSGGLGGTSGSLGGSSGTPGTGGTIVTMCVPGVPVTSQIPRMTDVQYDTVVKDLLGLTVLTTAGNVAPSTLLAPDSEGSMTDIAWTGYLSAAETIAAEVMAGANKSKFIACDPAAAGTAGTTCLQNTIKTFGRKAFRRPLTADEVTSFMRFNSLTPAGAPADVAEAILYAFLASPSFIMLPELAGTAQGSAIPLNSFEVAARLSFLLWNSVPDDMLSTAADMGQLTTKDQIAAQAKRLLQSDKAGAVVKSFHQRYLGIENNTHWTNNNTHDATKFPAFTSASYVPAIAEIDSFFQDVVLKGGTFKDLFLSNVAFVTKDTAKIYGLDPSGFTTTLTRTTLDATARPGFLTRAGFLSTFSHFDSSSPILRGAFVSGKVLGIPIGTPDPKFLGMTAPPANYTTNRQAVEALTSGSPCNTCHTTKVNPSGFVLERYDSVGGWQDKDPLGGDIDSTADVMLSLSPDVTKTISTPLQLMTEITQQPKAQRAYAQAWVAFATARDQNNNDTCTVDSLAGNLANTSYTIISMMADYTQADSFRLRTAGN
jgi:hypothetical protein